MKKRLATLLTISLVFLLCSCAKNDANEAMPNESIDEGNPETEMDDSDHQSVQTEVDAPTQQNTQTEIEKETSAFEAHFKDAPFWVQDENGLYGFIDQTGNYVIDPQFCDIGDRYKTFSFGVAFVQDNEGMPKLWGLIDTSGNYVIEPTFSDAGEFTSDELAYVQDVNSGLYGYVDPTGTYQIEPQFTEARSFVDGLAIVSRGYGYSYIDTSGTTVIPGEFEEANIFSDDLAPVKIGGLWGYIDHSGEFVIQPVYEEVYAFSDGVAFVRESYLTGYSLIDTKGNYIIQESAYTPAEGTPNDGRSTAKWVEGLCCVEVAVNGSDSEFDLNYAYINMNGEKVLPKDNTYYGRTWGFVKSDDGVYAVATDHDSGLYGYIDINGSWVVPPQYHNSSSSDISPFDGMGLVEENRKYIDMSGNILAKVDAPLAFVRQIGDYKDILVAAPRDSNGALGKCGYVYSDGSVALDFIYDASTGFSADGSYAFTQYEGLWGAIDIDGNWLIPAKFKSMQGNYTFIQEIPK